MLEIFSRNLNNLKCLKIEQVPMINIFAKISNDFFCRYLKIFRMFPIRYLIINIHIYLPRVTRPTKFELNVLCKYLIKISSQISEDMQISSQARFLSRLLAAGPPTSVVLCPISPASPSPHREAGRWRPGILQTPLAPRRTRPAPSESEVMLALPPPFQVPLAQYRVVGGSCCPARPARRANACPWPMHTSKINASAGPAAWRSSLSIGVST